MKGLKFKVIGTSPIIMHSDQGVDPTHPLTKKSKKISSKRNKTEEDQIDLMYLDWQLGLYYDENDGPIIPSANIERCLTDSAKLQKSGAAFKRGVRIPSAHSKLGYKGPRKIEDLMSDKHWDNFKNVKPMKVSTSKVLRCRPIFKDWHLFTEVFFDEAILDDDQIITVFNNAGKYMGLCDSRPKYGAFTVELLD